MRDRRHDTLAKIHRISSTHPGWPPRPVQTVNQNTAVRESQIDSSQTHPALDAADAQRQREAQPPSRRGIAPGRGELAAEALDRLATERLLGGFDGGPGVDIAGERFERPGGLDGERRRRKLREREIEGAVALLDMPPLRRPVRADHLPVE